MQLSTDCNRGHDSASARQLKKMSANQLARILREGQKAQQGGDLIKALEHAQTILSAFPQNLTALQLKGQCQLMAGDAQGCVDTMTLLLTYTPRDAMALNNRAVALDQLGRTEQALVDYESACRTEPDYLDALLNRAICLDKLGRHSDAVLAYRQLLQRDPRIADAHYGLGNALDRMGEPEAAVAAYQAAVKMEPTHGLAWYNMANVLLDMKRLEEAVEAYGQASTALPNYAPIYNNCANAFKALYLYDDALTLYDAALAVDPESTDTRYNKALLLNNLQRWLLAVEACAELIKRAPDHARGHNNLGVALSGLRQYVAALDAYKTAARLQPDMPEAYANQAGTLEMLQRHEEAIDAYKQALQLLPTYPHLPGRLAYKQLYICDWSDFEVNRKRILDGTAGGHAVCDPFRILAFSDSAKDHAAVAQLWSTQLTPPVVDLGPAVLPARHQRIRVGYFSADFHLHATALLMAQFFELHDKSKFEVMAFSFGAKDHDAMNERLRRSFDHYFDVRSMDDDAVVCLARQMELDIAVDLKGYTLDSRIGIFQRRAAPIQVNYLGFPGTMGVPFIDYILADYTLVPDDLRTAYTEKVIRVPGSYQVNDQHRAVAQRTPSRKELGLPEDAFVFCCFNNNYKITPALFDIWMRLLQKVPSSVLWLLSDNPKVVENLQREAQSRGIAHERLVFAPRASVEDHLARQKAADLFLDTVPCNAHTTASDALWVGLPVLTCTGSAFASRVAASLVLAQGLDELVTENLAAYEAKALDLAQDPCRMKALRQKTEQAIKTGLLFNTPELTRAIERGFEAAYERAHSGYAPDHIDV